VRIRVLLRYEWQPPGTIRWTLLDSDHCSAGRGDIRVSRVDAEIDHRRPSGLMAG
jgi:hypothetical protein